MVKAMFWENCAVVHKPHRLNEATDKVWAKIMKPLVDVGALSFVSAAEGRALTKDERLSKIYFTGGTSTAQAIMNAIKMAHDSETHQVIRKMSERLEELQIERGAVTGQRPGRWPDTGAVDDDV